MATTGDSRTGDERARPTTGEGTGGERVRDDLNRGGVRDDRAAGSYRDADGDGIPDDRERGGLRDQRGTGRSYRDADGDGVPDDRERGRRGAVATDRHDRRSRRRDRGVVEGRIRDDEAARERFGGINWGAAFFGWLVAVGMTALLTGIIAVVATAIGYSNSITTTDAQRQAGTVTTVTAIVLLVVLLVAYYAGGYVAGRMSRFDGGKQGLAAWLVGLIITIIAAALGWLAGDQYNLLDRVDVPRIPIPSNDVTVAGIVVAVLVLLVTLFASMLGGKVGRRYHARVDRAAY